jgi:hypothetical protein
MPSSRPGGQDMMKDLDMHRPLLLLSVIALSIASIGIASMAASLDSSPTTHTASARDVSTVLRYYEAVNEIIATGDPASLRTVLHTDLTKAGSPVGEQDAHGSLEGYLTWLHEIAPDTRLAPGPVASDGEQVIAQVSVSTSTGSVPLGFSLSDPSMLWPAFEVFRVTLGQITERRAPDHHPPELRERYSEGPSTPLADGATLEMASYELTGISRVRMSTSSMPAVFRVTGGNPMLSLAMTAPEAAILLDPARDTAQEIGTAVLPGTAGKARQGVIMVIPPNSGFSLLNVKDEPASLVSVSVSLAAETEHQSPELSYPSESGISIVEHLARPLENTSSGARFSLGTVRMEPGASLNVSPDTMLMALLDSPEELLLSGRDPGCRDATARPTPGDPSSELPSGVSMLCPDAELVGLLTNVGKAPVTVWVVAVVTAQNNAPQ